MFIEGVGEIALDDDVLPIEAGTLIRVGPNVWSALRCLPESPTPLKWLYIRAGGENLSSIGNDAEIESERPYPWA